MKVLYLLAAILLCDAQKNIPRYLNSYGHCTSGPNVVDSGTTYTLTADAQPGTKTQSSLVSCELVFRAAKEEGQLCIIQDDILNTLEDSNVEIIVKDGYEDDEKDIFTIKYTPSTWQHREYCTTSQYLTVTLRRINNNLSVAVSKLNVNMKVVNIENKNRKIYLDELYCDDDYFLSNSIVRVYNRAPTTGSKSTKAECGVNIIKRSGGDSRLCLVYIPSDKPSTHARWLFAVSNKSYSLDKKHILYNMSWDDSRIKSKHVWCASNETIKVMLILKRLDTNSITEPAESLSYILTDHVGSEEDLHRLDFTHSEHETDTDTVYYLVISAVALFIFCVFVIMVILKRDYLRKIFCTDYTQANNPQNKC